MNIDNYSDPCIFVRQQGIKLETKDIDIKKDMNGDLLKVGDRVKSSNGMIGRLVNYQGKTWIEHDGNRTLLSTVNTINFEKVS